MAMARSDVAPLLMCLHFKIRIGRILSSRRHFLQLGAVSHPAKRISILQTMFAAQVPRTEGACDAWYRVRMLSALTLESAATCQATQSHLKEPTHVEGSFVRELPGSVIEHRLPQSKVVLGVPALSSGHEA